MADTTAPTLTSLDIQKTVDLSSGPAGLTISGTATDDISGVKQVIVWFDKSFAYSFSLGTSSSSNYRFLGNYGITDSWGDGASSETWGIADSNPSGTYNVQKVTVDDQQGNTRTYLPSELKSMGVNTSVTFTGSHADVTAPTLTTLAIQKTVDLSSGPAGLTISGTATDDISGVKQVIVWFDKSFAYSFSLGTSSSSIYSFLGNYGITDSWSDGASSETWGIADSNPSGTYSVQKVTVDDQQGNTRTYLPSELSQLGISTSVYFADHVVDGTEDKNTLVGTTDGDQINGLGGKDRLIGGGGNDFLDGGKGIDTAIFTGKIAVTVDLAIKTVQATGQGSTQLINIENVTSGAGADHLRGDRRANILAAKSGNDHLFGAAGNDLLQGGSGKDELVGGSGSDRLEGGAGSDHLAGGSGNDTITGGSGKDALSGNGGADTFVFHQISDVGRGSTRDIISDFTSRADHIDFSGIDANQEHVGDQAFHLIGALAFSGVAGELRYKGYVVSGDVDGDGLADFHLEMANHAALGTSDFLL